jgi:hypothetical protein
MRQLIGTTLILIAGIVFLAGGSLFGLVLLALGVSAIAFVINPQSPAGIPGGMTAMLIGSIVAVAHGMLQAVLRMTTMLVGGIGAVVLIAVMLDGFFDDC